MSVKALIFLNFLLTLLLPGGFRVEISAQAAEITIFAPGREVVKEHPYKLTDT